MEANTTELRILSGIHSGATVPTAEVAISIGSESTCQVILADPGILPQHAKITVSGQQWTIEGLDDTELGSHQYPFGEIVWLSTVAITVDQTQNPWPQKIAPPKRQTTPSAAPAITEKNTAATANTPEKTEEANKTPDIVVDNEALAPPPNKNLTETVLLKIQQGPTSLILIVLSVLLLLVASTLTAYVFHRKQAYQSNITQEDKSKALQGRAESLLMSVQQSQLAIAVDGNQHLSITGWVRTEDDLERVKRAFLKFQPEPTFAVFAEQSFEAAVNKLVASESKSMHASFPKPGIVALTGFGHEADIAHLSDSITSNIPGVKTVYYDAVSQPANIAEAFKNQAQALGLSMLTLHFDGKTMHAHGTLTSSQIAQWENLLSAFQKKYGNLLAIEAVIDEMPDDIHKGHTNPLRTDEHSPEYGAYGIHSVVGGVSQYVIMNDGRIVTVGGRIGQFRLSDITLDTVVLDGPQHLVIHR